MILRVIVWLRAISAAVILRFTGGDLPTFERLHSYYYGFLEQLMAQQLRYYTPKRTGRLSRSYLIHRFAGGQVLVGNFASYAGAVRFRYASYAGARTVRELILALFRTAHPNALALALARLAGEFTFVIENLMYEVDSVFPGPGTNGYYVRWARPAGFNAAVARYQVQYDLQQGAGWQDFVQDRNNPMQITQESVYVTDNILEDDTYEYPQVINETLWRVRVRTDTLTFPWSATITVPQQEFP